MAGITGIGIYSKWEFHGAPRGVLRAGIGTPSIYGYAGDFFISGILIGIVMLEVFILAINKFRCPLSDIAARYTDDRKENFDIYIPIWLAKRNKQLFGGLFLVGLLYTLIKWVVSYNAT